MGIAVAIRSFFSAVKAETGDLQEEVTHQTVTRDALGSETPSGVPVMRTAIVTRKQGLVPGPGGQDVKILATVSFLEPVPIGTNDKLTLADGTTGPLFIPQGGMTDPDTGQPYTRTVFIRR